MIKGIFQKKSRVTVTVLILSILFLPMATFLSNDSNSKPFVVYAESSDIKQIEIIDNTIKDIKSYLTINVNNPTVGSMAGDWIVCGIARSQGSIAKDYSNIYLKNVKNFIKENKGELSRHKYTEYSRAILAITAIEEDVANIEGYNLLNKLSDFDYVSKQGINGPIYALIALDSKNYTIPYVDSIKTQTTRDMLIDYLIDNELLGGGFALGGIDVDPDVTAMALQALAKYKSQPKVADCIERALEVLSFMQADDGSIINQGVRNCESTAQLIATLSTLGIDLKADRRFIKTDCNGMENNLLTALLNYRTLDGSFKHTVDGLPDQMATEQALLALIAYERFVNKRAPLFHMDDLASSEYNPGAFYKYKVLLDGEYLMFDQPPVNINQRILVPMRGIFEALGADVQWDNEMQKVIGIFGNREVSLVIGQHLAHSNEKPIFLDVPGIIIKQRTMVPIRFIGESLGVDVDWEGATNTVIITK